MKKYSECHIAALQPAVPIHRTFLDGSLRASAAPCTMSIGSIFCRSGNNALGVLNG